MTLYIFDHTGDTLGTMDTAEEGPFNQSQHPWYRPRTVALPLPLVAYREGSLTIDASSMRNTCNVGTYVTPLFCTNSSDYRTVLYCVRIIIWWHSMAVDNSNLLYDVYHVQAVRICQSAPALTYTQQQRTPYRGLQ